MKVLKRAGVIALVIVFLFGCTLFVNEKLNGYVFVRNYTFSHKEIPQDFDGYKILMISDLHEAPFSEQIIKHIKNEVPDIIVITGDMTQLPDFSIDETIKIKDGAGDIPMYAISGNHDTQGGKYKEICTMLRKNGIIPLDDTSVCLEKGDSGILLIGVKDPIEDIVTEEKIKVMQKKIKKQFPSGPCFSILLSHRADLYPKMKNCGVDLILSGHMHGGIVRLPFVGGLIGKSEEKPFFPEYDYGFYEYENAASMIVSGGCDKNREKKRYFNPPEVLLITLESGM